MTRRSTSAASKLVYINDALRGAWRDARVNDELELTSATVARLVERSGGPSMTPGRVNDFARAAKIELLDVDGVWVSVAYSRGAWSLRRAGEAC